MDAITKPLMEFRIFLIDLAEKCQCFDLHLLVPAVVAVASHTAASAEIEAEVLVLLAILASIPRLIEINRHCRKQALRAIVGLLLLATSTATIIEWISLSATQI